MIAHENVEIRIEWNPMDLEDVKSGLAKVEEMKGRYSEENGYYMRHGSYPEPELFGGGVMRVTWSVSTQKPKTS